MIEITLCSGNAGKRAEFERILGRSLSTESIALPEIQSLDTEEVCRAKAAEAFRILNRPVLVDDTGFEIAALQGFPGALVMWILAVDGVSTLQRLLPPGSARNACAVTSIGLAGPDGVFVFTGRTEGVLLAEARGSGGFGFDPVFVPADDHRTLAEMPDDEKDQHSPRGIALAKLSQHLLAG